MPSPSVTPSSPDLSCAASLHDGADADGPDKPSEGDNLSSRPGSLTEEASSAVHEDAEPRFDLLVEMNGKQRRGEEGEEALNFGFAASRERRTKLSERSESVGERKFPSLAGSETASASPRARGLRSCLSSEAASSAALLAAHGDIALRSSSAEMGSREGPSTGPDTAFHLDGTSPQSTRVLGSLATGTADAGVPCTKSPSICEEARCQSPGSTVPGSRQDTRAPPRQEEEQRPQQQSKSEEERARQTGDKIAGKEPRRESGSGGEGEHKAGTSTANDGRPLNTVTAMGNGISPSSAVRTLLNSLAVQLDKPTDNTAPAERRKSLEMKHPGKKGSENDHQAALQLGKIREENSGASALREGAACPKTASEIEEVPQAREDRGTETQTGDKATLEPQHMQEDEVCRASASGLRTADAAALEESTNQGLVQEGVFLSRQIRHASLLLPAASVKQPSVLVKEVLDSNVESPQAEAFNEQSFPATAEHASPVKGIARVPSSERFALATVAESIPDMHPSSGATGNERCGHGSEQEAAYNRERSIDAEGREKERGEAPQVFTATAPHGQSGLQAQGNFDSPHKAGTYPAEVVRDGDSAMRPPVQARVATPANREESPRQSAGFAQGLALEQCGTLQEAEDLVPQSEAHRGVPGSEDYPLHHGASSERTEKSPRETQLDKGPGGELHEGEQARLRT